MSPFWTPPINIISNLTGICIVDISNNNFEGVLDFSMFANLSNLGMLYLSSNRRLEIETESRTWIPSFQLKDSSLTNCTINKRSGSVIPNFISTQRRRLDYLDLSNSSLSGSIPSWWFYNSTLRSLLLGQNTLDGMFPHIMPHHNMSSKLVLLDASSNHVHGSLPTNIDILFPNLLYLFMSADNNLRGSVPPSLGRMPLESLLLDNNNLSGEMSQHLARNWTTLKYIDLSKNDLEGELFPGDFNLPKLTYLCLRDNRLFGQLPPRLSNSSHLKVLDVGNNDLTGDLSKSLPISVNMLALLLRGNHFEGHIPSHLCQMQHLQYLDLSGNRFSGHIPTCLSNVSLWKSQKEVGSNPLASDDPSGSLEYGLKLTVRSIGIEFTIKSTSRIYHGAPLFWMTMIDLSSNQLDGTIPSEIGELRQLRSLNLSHNLLGGHLPVSLCNLESLESLDLSHNNKLNGTIPHEMVQLNSLSTFSVAFNNLSGMIPFDRQFSTFTEDKYEGNPGLCGPPLKRNCSSNDAEQSHEAEEKEDEEKPGIVDSDVFFYSCVAMSFVLGFWSYIALLFFNKKWRVRIFKVVDKYSDLCFKR